MVATQISRTRKMQNIIQSGSAEPMPAAGATRDFQWRSNHDSTSQRQKIEIGQTGHLHPARVILTFWFRAFSEWA
jgi:hypothetical protein